MEKMIELKKKLKRRRSYQLHKMKIYILIFLLTLFLFSVDAKELSSVYIVSLTLTEDENIILDDIHLSTSFKERDFLTGPFTLRLVSSDRDTLYIYKFDFIQNTPPLEEWFDDTGKQIKTSEKPISRKVTLVVPYFEEAKEMHIYNPNGELTLNIDLSKFCRVEGCLIEEDERFFSKLFNWIKSLINRLFEG